MSVDEILCADKQYIKGRPVRFGFKLWAAFSSEGALLHVDPYCSQHTNIEDLGFGHGPNIVLDVVNKAKLQKGKHDVCDNYFGIEPFLKELARKGIAGTTPLREDCLSRCPLTARTIMNKKARGRMEEAFTEYVSLVKGKENKVVRVESNKARSQPLQHEKRWDRITKKHIYIQVPNSISLYNKYMEGLNTFDQQVSAYRIRIR